MSNQPVSNQTVINQPKSPVIAAAAQGGQLIPGQQIRFANQPTIVNNNGQIVAPAMSVNQFQVS